MIVGNAERVFSSNDLSMAAVVATMLARHGIASERRGEHRSGLAGAISTFDALVEVWVERSEGATARRLVDELIGTSATRAPRGAVAVADARGQLAEPDPCAPSVQLASCPACGAETEDGFEVCWQCGGDL